MFKKSKKKLDHLTEIFTFFFEILLYSIALKLFLGISWMFGSFYIWLGKLAWFTQVVISVIVGLFLRELVKGYIENKKK